MFKKLFLKLRNRRKLKEISRIAGNFKSIEELKRSGLLHWDARKRQLLVAESLAVLVMNIGSEGWKHFLRNIFMWQFFNEQNAAWESYFLDVEKAAIRQARKVTPIMNKMQIQQIRQSARAKVQKDAIAPPKIKPFEFFILRESDKECDLVAIGRYNPESSQSEIEMELWETVTTAMKKKD